MADKQVFQADTPGRWTRFKWLSRVLLIILAAAFSAGALASAAAPEKPAPAEPALGTYHWPVGTKGVDAFAAWLGRPTVWG